MQMSERELIRDRKGKLSKRAKTESLDLLHLCVHCYTVSSVLVMNAGKVQIKIFASRGKNLQGDSTLSGGRVKWT